MIRPQRDMTKRCIPAGGAGTRTDNLWHHYDQEIGWKKAKLIWSGMYGPYWTSHFGMHHHYLKRRMNRPGVYNKSNPVANWYERKLDNLGIDWIFPDGQFQLIVWKWLLYIW